GDGVAEDVPADHLLLAVRRPERTADLREALLRLHVEFVLVVQAGHQPTAGAGNLRRVERQPLVLRELEGDWLDFRAPQPAAELAAAPAEAAQALRLVAHPDLPQLDAGLERAGHVLHESAEVDALVGREVDGELVAVPLPFRLADLHAQALTPHDLA